MRYAVFQVVDTVGDNTVAAIAVAEVASVVDLAVGLVRLVATEGLTPRKYFAVAIAAVDSADMGLAVVASYIPLST